MVRRATRPLRIRFRSVLFLLPSWFSPSSQLRAAFHRARGARIAGSAEIGYIVMIDNLYPEKVTVEENATVAAMSAILAHDESHAYTGGGPERIAETCIREGAFVGIRSIILPGVTVGRRAIVAAGSVVTKDVLDGQTVAGVPASPVGSEEPRPDLNAPR